MPGLMPSLASILPHSPGPYVALVIGGFLVGVLGHLSSSRRLVAIGIALVVLGALLLPLAVRVSGGAPGR